MSAVTPRARAADGTIDRPIAVYALALLGPIVAWLAWTSWSMADANQVAWFATVAVDTVIIGALASKSGTRHHLSLASVVIAVTLTVLWLRWSAYDTTGLFGIGFFVFALPATIGGVPLALAVGHVIASRRRRDP